MSCWVGEVGTISDSTVFKSGEHDPVLFAPRLSTNSVSEKKGNRGPRMALHSPPFYHMWCRMCVLAELPVSGAPIIGLGCCTPPKLHIPGHRRQPSRPLQSSRYHSNTYTTERCQLSISELLGNRNFFRKQTVDQCCRPAT